MLKIQKVGASKFLKQVSCYSTQGVKKVLHELKQPFPSEIFPEQAIHLLSVLHYMLQNEAISKEQFLESNIHVVTSSLNSSFIVDRLQTDLNLTMSRSVSFVPNWDNTPKQAKANNNYFSAEPELRKSATDTKIQIQELREPLNYQQILQLYYAYLKRVCIQQMSGMILIDCFVLQNIQALGLRIIEGQRIQKLRFCFNLVVKDMINQQDAIINLISKIERASSQDIQQLKEIHNQMYLNSKQLKFYGLINKVKVDQQKMKEFKKNNKVAQQKYRICESTDRLHQNELKNELHFYKYERVQMYNQF